MVNGFTSSIGALIRPRRDSRVGYFSPIVLLVRSKPIYRRGCHRHLFSSYDLDWICTLPIIDDSYPSPGLTVNVFSNSLEELPHIKSHEDISLFTRIKMKTFDGGKRVNAACDKWISSFALFEGGIGKDLVCYQCTSNLGGEAQYKSFMDDLHKAFAGRSEVYKVLQTVSCGIKPSSLENFSFLREIKEGKCFDLVCRILHADEDLNTIFVWDGTDAPPPSILEKEIVEEKAFSSLSVHTLLSREILVSFPTVGTILRVSLRSHLFHKVKPGDWVKLCNIFCEVDRGSWVGKVTYSTKGKRRSPALCSCLFSSRNIHSRA